MGYDLDGYDDEGSEKIVGVKKLSKEETEKISEVAKERREGIKKLPPIGSIEHMVMQAEEMKADLGVRVRKAKSLVIVSRAIREAVVSGLFDYNRGTEIVKECMNNYMHDID